MPEPSSAGGTLKMAEITASMVKDLREKNYRKSILLRETVSSQQQLQAQLSEKVC